MTYKMPPFDQSRQFLYDFPGEKRSSSFERWLNLQGDNGGAENQGNGPDIEERDGGDGNDNPGNGDNKNGNNDGDGNGKHNKDKDNSNPPPASTLSSATIIYVTPLLVETATTTEPITTAFATLQPAIQPAAAAEPTPEVTFSPVATTTQEPLELPTTTLPAAQPTTTTTTEAPPETTSTSYTPIIIVGSPMSTPISVPIATMTEMPVQITFSPTSGPVSSSISTSVVTMTMLPSAVVTSITATTTEIVVLETSSSQRKSDKNHDSHKNATSTVPPSLADTSGMNPDGISAQHEAPLSPTAEHVLIAAGVIGAFILMGFLLYLFVRLRKIPMGEKFDDFLDSHPRVERMLSVIPAIRNRGRWSRRASSIGGDSSRTYESTAADEKSMEAFYENSATKGGLDAKSSNTSATEVASKHDSHEISEKAAITYGMSTNPNKPLTITNPSATMSFYNVQPPNNAYLPDTARMTRMTQMSDLSSLSSGFGDAQIDVPESGPGGTLNSAMNGYNSTLNSNAATNNTTLQPYRQSFMQRASRAFAEPLTSRFSWTTANQTDTGPAGGQRDTMYTTTSEDSAPRFRTIHSWVNQQTNRVERGRTEHVPSMPPLPPSQRHLKRGSEEPAFRHHPGEEINIPAPNRIESAILDGKLGTGGV